MPDQVGALHPEPRRHAVRSVDLEAVALACAERDRLRPRPCRGRPAEHLGAFDPHHAVGATLGSAAQPVGARLRHLEKATRQRLVSLLPALAERHDAPDLEVADAIDRQRALGHRRVGAEEDAAVDVLGAAQVPHPDHVGLAGENVDLDRFDWVAGEPVGIREIDGDLGCGHAGQGEPSGERPPRGPNARGGEHAASIRLRTPRASTAVSDARR